MTMRGVTSTSSVMMRALFVRPGKAPVGASLTRVSLLPSAQQHPQQQQQQQVRTHMTHHHPAGRRDPNLSEPTSPSGPRTPGIVLGLEAATGIHNLLRLLESSHGPTATAAAAAYSCWHPHGKIWRLEEEEDETKGWKLHALGDDVATTAPAIRTAPPGILWLQFSDARTALAKIRGADGWPRYLSLLQLDEHKPHHDGWRIVRELVSAATASSGRRHPPSFASIQQTCLAYQQVEHGGGLLDHDRAATLLDPRATLLTVGCDEHSSTPSNGSSHNPWEAPAGHFLEIPRATYLEGVMTQTPHGQETSLHDEIVSIDVMPCNTAAAAVVRVGNGTQTRVLEDHLLLGRSSTNSESSDWRILSKTFSTHSWPLY